MGHEETARGANGRFRPIPAARTGRVRAGCPHELVAGSEERGGRPVGGGGSAPGPLLSSWVDASTRGSPELRPRGAWQVGHPVGRTCDRGVRVQGTTRSSPTFSGYVSRPGEPLTLHSVFAQRAGPVGLLQTVRSCLWGGGATKAGLGPLIRGAARPGSPRQECSTDRPPNGGPVSSRRAQERPHGTSPICDSGVAGEAP